MNGKGKQSRWEKLAAGADIPMKKPADPLRPMYATFAPSLGKVRLQMRVQQEVGQRSRAYGRIPTEDEPLAAIGENEQAAINQVMSLSKVLDGFLPIPDRGDRRLIGKMVYVGGTPPNPYQWAPVIARFTPDGGIVWEMGPGASPSAGFACRTLGRSCYLMRLPELGSMAHEVRFVHGRIDSKDIIPALVLVPLPLPVDVWSIRQHVQMKHRCTEPIWLIRKDQDPTLAHPEFALTIGDYLIASVERLRTLGDLVRDKGTRVCVTVPMVLGVPAALEKSVRKVLGWQAAARYTVVQEHGTRHVGNGSPIVGESMTVWEAP